MTTYSVYRFYRDGHEPELLEEGLTLEEAQEYCSNPEGSSRTCTSSEGALRTSLKGPWFEGYREE